MLHTTPGKKYYPPQLCVLHKPPTDLYIESNNWPDLLQKPMLAVVGSRKVSTYGREIITDLVRAAASRGVVIVSGLALGTDALAHQAALDVGGHTIAVLPAGLQHIYPSSHHSLARTIVAKGGALITEYPPHSKVAFKGNFIARNRIISGLSSAVLIPEASEKSGSLHTANFALEQGKEVFAVPGPITSQLSSGCNNLIKSGAQVVTNTDDILNYFGLSSVPHTQSIAGDTPEETIILTLLVQGVTDIDELQQQAMLAAEEFQQAVSMLEIKGQIQAVGGGKIALR
ncbi:MAG: DNA-processing protein DprA [Candidatus Saccharimonadales bacterium]